MPEKILIVDDDVESLKLIGLMLHRQGYEVVAANSGGQALTRVKAETPDLIILDVMMPDMSGYEVCRRIRANPDLRSVPILMFTAKTLIDDKVAGFEAGADDYLTKPTHPAELTARIKTMLARSVPQQTKTTSTHGAVIGILGAKGGIGATTLAVNFAAGCQKTNKRPIVADFNIGSGGVGLLMGITDNSGLMNMLKVPSADIRPSTVDRELVAHASGIRALLNQPLPKEAMQNHPSDSAVATVQAMRSLADVVVLDLGSRYTLLNHRLMGVLDRVIVFFDPSEAGLALGERLIKDLKAESQRRVDAIVLNRTQNQTPIAWHEVENRIGQGLLSIVAYVPDIAQQAAQAHQPIMTVKPNTIFVNQMVKLAEDILA